MSEDARPLVVHVLHHLVMGGMENGLVNLVNRLPESQFRHAIVCVEDHSEFAERIERDDVEVIDMHRSRIGARALRRDLRALFTRLRPAIVHSRAQSGLDALLPAALARVPARIHSEHGRDVDDLYGTRFKPRLLRFLHAPLVSHYIAVSEELRQYLIKRVHVRASKVTRVCNGVDVARFSPAEARPAGPMPRDLAPAGTVVFGTVGRAQAVKDQQTLLHAFARASERSAAFAARARLCVVGDGPKLEDLRALAASLGIEARSWLPGAERDVPNVLRGMDVFVLPSLAEGISNTLLEAMASGLPLLATAVGGNAELVADGATGTLYSPADADLLAGHLEAYFEDEERRARESRAARTAAVERFSIDAMLGAYADIYQRFGAQAV